MENYRKKRRLLFRRAVVCLVLAGVLALLGFGVFKGTGVLMKMAEGSAASAAVLSSSPPDASSRAVSSRAASSAASAVSSAVPAVSREEEAVSAPPPSSAPATASVRPPAPGTPAPGGWFRDAVFVGDSRTEGLENFDGLDGATYYAVKGLMVDTIYTKQAVRDGSSKITVMRALQKKKFKKVYIMLGVNELGWSSFATFISDYGKVIDDIKKYQPGTRIYLQAILPVTAQKSTSSSIYNNSRIINSNNAIRDLAKKKQVYYLAVDEAMKDASGALPSEATVDGVHLNAAYCKKWCEYLKLHI